MSDIEELDKYFSIYIRTLFADWKGDVLCYTCPARGHWKTFDAGHFRKRQYLTTRWERNNCRPQCKECNQHGEGKVETFESELRDEIGDDEVNKIIERSHEQFELGNEWVRDQITHYKRAVAPYL